MTQRLKGFVVTLKEDMREDDAEMVLTALRMVKGVIDVQPVEASHDDQIVRSRIRHNLWRKINALFEPGADS